MSFMLGAANSKKRKLSLSELYDDDYETVITSLPIEVLVINPKP